MSLLSITLPTEHKQHFTQCFQGPRIHHSVSLKKIFFFKFGELKSNTYRSTHFILILIESKIKKNQLLLNHHGSSLTCVLVPSVSAKRPKAAHLL